jgi:serine/threonine protein kinase
VHRDLKPQNVFVITRRDGRRHVKVLDFGISKMAGDVGGALTRTSDVLGSPYYMSPEQLLATRDVGPSGDVWALGVILYEMLTGAVPFRGETLAQITLQIIQAPHVPFPQARADVPPWLATIVDRCLQKDPAQRMPSVDALAAALRARGAGAPQPNSSQRVHAATAVMPHGAQTALHPSSGQVPQAAPVSTMLHSQPSVTGPHAQLAQGASTNVGWGHSSQPGTTQLPTTGSKTLYLIGAAVAVVLLSVGGFGIHHFVRTREAAVSAKPASDTPPPPPASASVTPIAIETATSTTTSATPSASVAAPAVAPKTTTSATAKSTAAGSATTKPPATTTSHPATTTTKPQGAEPDFLPSLRK